MIAAVPSRVRRAQAFICGAPTAALILGGCLSAPEPSSLATGTEPPTSGSGAAVSPIVATPATAGPPSLGVLLAAPAGAVMTTGMYFITIIADDGRVVASTKAREPSAADGFFLPRVSASRTGVYYLEGDTEIRLLRPDGSSTTIRKVPGGAHDRVVFAVSHDDDRMVSTMLHYGPPAAGCLVSCSATVSSRTFVEQLTSGAGRSELVASFRELDFSFAYPVGWHLGMIVLADGDPAIQNPAFVNPYAARDRYALVDPKADRVAQRIGAAPNGSVRCRPSGPLAAAGVACIGERSVSFWTWDGSFQTFLGDSAVMYDINVYRHPAALSPNGSRVAVTLAGGRIVLPPSPARLPAAVSGSPIGWLDRERLVFLAFDAGKAGARIYDAARGSVSSVALSSESLTVPYPIFFAGLTTGLD